MKKEGGFALKGEHRITTGGKDYSRTLYLIKLEKDEDLEAYMQILLGGFEAVQGFTLNGIQCFLLQKVEEAKVQSALSRPEK